MDYLISSLSFMFWTNVFTKKLILRFRCHFCGKCVAANLSIFERFKIKRRQNDECLSMYIINTIPHGKCFVRYLRTSCFCIRNFTRSLRSLVRLIFSEWNYWGPHPNLEKIVKKKKKVRIRVLNASSKTHCTLHFHRNLAGKARLECNRKACCFVHN